MDDEFDPNRHFVDFHKYCWLCKHRDLNGDLEPCNECLTYPENEEGSRKPVKFESNLPLEKLLQNIK